MIMITNTTLMKIDATKGKSVDEEQILHHFDFIESQFFSIIIQKDMIVLILLLFDRYDNT